MTTYCFSLYIVHYYSMHPGLEPAQRLTEFAVGWGGVGFELATAAWQSGVL